MTTPTPIACDLHDHIEVACLYRYELEVHLADGTVVTGRALTTQTRRDKTEHLILGTNEDSRPVPLHDIRRIDVTTPGARFTSLSL
ncbi:MAG: Rho-binding antiterminator [Pseudomonadota bacterium]